MRNATETLNKIPDELDIRLEDGVLAYEELELAENLMPDEESGIEVNPLFEKRYWAQAI